MDGVFEQNSIGIFYHPASLEIGVLIESTSDEDWLALKTRSSGEYIVSALPSRRSKLLWPVPMALFRDARAITHVSDGRPVASAAMDSGIGAFGEDQTFLFVFLGDRKVGFEHRDEWRPWEDVGAFRRTADAPPDYVIPLRSGDVPHFGPAIATRGGARPLAQVTAKLDRFEGPGLASTIDDLRQGGEHSKGTFSAPGLGLETCDTDNAQKNVTFVYWRYPQSGNEPLSWPLSSCSVTTKNAASAQGFEDAGSFFQHRVQKTSVPGREPLLEIEPGHGLSVRYASCGLMDVIGFASSADGPWLSPAGAGGIRVNNAGVFYRIHDVRSEGDLLSTGLVEQPALAAEYVKKWGTPPNPSGDVAEFQEKLLKGTEYTTAQGRSGFHLRNSLSLLKPEFALQDVGELVASESLIAAVAKASRGAGGAGGLQNLHRLSIANQAELILHASRDNLNLSALARLLRDEQEEALEDIDWSELTEILAADLLNVALCVMVDPPGTIAAIASKRDQVKQCLDQLKADMEMLRSAPMPDDFSVESLTKRIVRAEGAPVVSADYEVVEDERRQAIEDISNEVLKAHTIAFLDELETFRSSNLDALRFLTEIFASLGWLASSATGDAPRRVSELNELADRLASTVRDIDRIQQMMDHGTQAPEPEWTGPRAAEFEDCVEEVTDQLASVRKTMLNHRGKGGRGDDLAKLEAALDIVERNVRWVAHLALWRKVNVDIEERIANSEGSSLLSDAATRHRLLRQGPPSSWPEMLAQIERVLQDRHPETSFEDRQPPYVVAG